MKASTFTEGKWSVAYEGCVRATTPWGEEVDIYNTDYSRKIPARESEANAKLIAAAPELLRMLRRARLVMSARGDKRDYQLLDDMEAAIAAAVGNIDGDA